jgi:choline kinase
MSKLLSAVSQVASLTYYDIGINVKYRFQISNLRGLCMEIKTPEDLERILENYGYSKSAIVEIAKWYT